MPIKKVKPKKKTKPTPEWLINGLKTGEWPKAGEEGCFDRFTRKFGKEWAKHKKEIMPGWINEHPGTRPWAWWKFDAPEMRKRLSGNGDPDFEHLGVKKLFNFGIPTHFMEQWMVDYYNGRLKHVDGGFVKCKWKEGDCDAIAYDPDDPPVYETEYEYLKRLNLLTKSEKINI